MSVSVEKTVSPLQLTGLTKRWNWFFFESADPSVCAAVRIGYSVLLLLMLLVQMPQLELWFSNTGVLPFDISRFVIDTDTTTLFFFLPDDIVTLKWCYFIFVLQAVLLLVGFCSRFQAICLLVWLTSFHHRNGMLLDGEDTVFRIFAFLLACSPCGCCWSVDSWLQSKRTGIRRPALPETAWALRLMQLQMTIIYVSTAWEKLNGNAWLDGTALYYASRLDDVFGRGPVPDFLFNNLTALKFMTWGVLVVEVLLPIGLWIRETRRSAVLLGIALHLSIEWMMNLYLFEWIMIVGLMTFVTSDDVTWFKRIILRRPLVTVLPPLATSIGG